MSEGLCHQ